MLQLEMYELDLVVLNFHHLQSSNDMLNHHQMKY